MASRAHFDAARTRQIVHIQLSLQQQNFEKARNALQDALHEFPDDSDLQNMQLQLFRQEQTAAVAATLLKHGRRKVQYGDFEAGIEKLRQASHLRPTNREIQDALFDALARFAKIVVDHDSGRAEQLLQEAARISPLNLRIEKVGTYLAGRVRQRSVDQCLLNVENLRQVRDYREALKQVAALEEQLRAFPVPELEHMRQELFWDMATKSQIEIHVAQPPIRTGEAPMREMAKAASAEASVSGNPIHHPSSESEESVSDSETTATESTVLPASAPRRRILTRIQNILHEARQNALTSAQTLRIWTRARWKPCGAVSQNLMRTVAKDTSEALDSSVNWIRNISVNARDRSVGLLKAYPLAAGIACLVLVFAAVTIGHSDSEPSLSSIGTGTLMLPVTLHRLPSADSGIAGSLKSGETVEVLQQIPAESLDAWVRLRTSGNKGIDGYARLRNLDAIQTADTHFNLWYAMTLLNRSTSGPEFRKRLESVAALLKASPIVSLRDFDSANFTVAKSFARLAAENTADPEIARRDLETSESYLSRIQGEIRDSSEADIVKWSIDFTRASLLEKSGPPVTDGDEARR